MKHFILGVSLSLLLNTKSNSQSTDINSQFKKIEWLIGIWDRQNTRTGRTAFEDWKKTGATELTGSGVRMTGNDTTYVEKIKIVAKDNALWYVADVPENKEPVYFKMTEITDNGFVSENPEHDFPKKITYQLDNGQLKAQISGGSRVIDFLFKKRN